MGSALDLGSIIVGFCVAHEPNIKLLQHFRETMFHRGVCLRISRQDNQLTRSIINWVPIDQPPTKAQHCQAIIEPSTWGEGFWAHIVSPAVVKRDAHVKGSTRRGQCD